MIFPSTKSTWKNDCHLGMAKKIAQAQKQILNHPILGVSPAGLSIPYEWGEDLAVLGGELWGYTLTPMVSSA